MLDDGKQYRIFTVFDTRQNVAKTRYKDLKKKSLWIQIMNYENICQTAYLILQKDQALKKWLENRENSVK